MQNNPQNMVKKSNFMKKSAILNLGGTPACTKFWIFVLKYALTYCGHDAKENLTYNHYLGCKQHVIWNKVFFISLYIPYNFVKFA